MSVSLFLRFLQVQGLSQTKMQQQQLAGVSAGEPQEPEAKRLPHPAPTSSSNRSGRLHLLARPALVINWAGVADHVPTVFRIQVWFVVFMIKWNLEDPYRGNGSLQQQGCSTILQSLLFLLETLHFSSETKGRICMIGGGYIRKSKKGTPIKSRQEEWIMSQAERYLASFREHTYIIREKMNNKWISRHGLTVIDSEIIHTGSAALLDYHYHFSEPFKVIHAAVVNEAHSGKFRLHRMIFSFFFLRSVHEKNSKWDREKERESLH